MSVSRPAKIATAAIVTGFGLAAYYFYGDLLRKSSAEDLQKYEDFRKYAEHDRVHWLAASRLLSAQPQPPMARLAECNLKFPHMPTNAPK
jgi:hypothetical protein